MFSLEGTNYRLLFLITSLIIDPEKTDYLVAEAKTLAILIFVEHSAARRLEEPFVQGCSGIEIKRKIRKLHRTSMTVRI